MAEYTITLTDAQVKALLTDMVSIQTWLQNAANEKSRRVIDCICDKALSDQSNAILTLQEKSDTLAELTREGVILAPVKQWPDSVKAYVVNLARVKTAAEREIITPEPTEAQVEGNLLTRSLGRIFKR